MAKADFESSEDKLIKDATVVYEAVTSGKLITKPSELYRFMNALTGEVVPFQPVCSNHGTPWDMIWESYKVDLPGHAKGRGEVQQDIIAVGPREGFKTLSTAKLIAIELLLKPKIDIASIGAVMKQATRCYKYTSQYIFHPILAELGAVIKNIMDETKLANGSRYEQLVANMTGVNSPHPQKLRADEVELMKPEVVEEMKNVPSSYNGWQSHILYTSTRKFVEGVMSMLVEKNKKGGKTAKTIIWCYKEVSEPCPDERSGVNPQTYEVEDIFHNGEKIIVQAYEYCGDCVLLPSCRGDLKRSKGVIPIDDSIKKWIDLDRDTWLAQKESIEPPRTGLFFYDWDDKRHSGDYPYDPNLPVDMFCDFTGGGEDPSIFQFWQTKGADDFLVLELAYAKRATDIVAREVEQICRERGIRPGVMMGDSSQMQEIRNLRNASSFFNNLRPVKKVDRKEGLAICRRRLRDNSGARHTFINEKCTNFRHEIRNLKRKPSDPDDHKDGADHSIDAWRYRNIYRYHSMGEPRIRCLSDDSFDDDKSQGEQILFDAPQTKKVHLNVDDAIAKYLASED